MLTNAKRVYALAEYTVKNKGGKWYFRRTYNSEDAWKGPYSSEASVTLTIARQLKREIFKRDGLPS